MKLKIYKSEVFERNNSWYIAFSLVFISILVISIFYKNIVWAILMLFLIWAYFYYNITNNQEIFMEIKKDKLTVWNIEYDLNLIKWYTIEIDQKQNKIKNIVILTKKGHNIYTINDNDSNIKSFLEELTKLIPLQWEFNQTLWEKLSRKLKL